MRIHAAGAPIEQRAKIIAAAHEPLGRCRIEALDGRSSSLPISGERREARSCAFRMGAENPAVARSFAVDRVARDEAEDEIGAGRHGIDDARARLLAE